MKNIYKYYLDTQVRNSNQRDYKQKFNNIHLYNIYNNNIKLNNNYIIMYELSTLDIIIKQINNYKIYNSNKL
jgi:hypothetical protein